MEPVNERTTKYLELAFTDKNGDPVVPSTLNYRIDCLTSGEAVVDDTSVATAASVEIEITAAQNAMRNQGNATETRRITLKATYGGGGELNQQIDYQVVNLKFVS